MMAPNWGWFRALGMLLCGLIIILPSDAGAQDDPTRFDDPKYDFSISIPDPWKPADPKTSLSQVRFGKLTPALKMPPSLSSSSYQIKRSTRAGWWI
jgi:hypothetical protein